MLASSVRQLIAPILRECPADCGIVTITEVHLSNDLSFVTVSISALKKSEEALAFLKERRGELQKKLGALETHRTPQLRFRIDRRSEDGGKIDELLHKLSKDTPHWSS